MLYNIEDLIKTRCADGLGIITMMSREFVVSNHQPFDCLFHRLSGPTSKKHQSTHYWTFVCVCVGGGGGGGGGVIGHRWIPRTRGQWHAGKASLWWRHHSLSIFPWCYFGSYKTCVNRTGHKYDNLTTIHIYSKYTQFLYQCIQIESLCQTKMLILS